MKPLTRKRGRPATGKDPLITLRVPPDVIRKLDQIAAAEGVSRSEVIRAAIEARLKKR